MLSFLYRPAWLCMLTCLALGGCQPDAPPPIAEETPERQFILENLRLEERRDGRVLWQGTGKRGDGDLSVSDLTDLVLVRKPQEMGETEFTVRAPLGHMAFDDGQANFVTPRVSEPGGGVLTAHAATYEEKTGELTAEGPLNFTTPSMVVHAASGIFWLRDGRFDAQGPVVGRFTQGLTPKPL
jgi:hypothetical protein